MCGILAIVNISNRVTAGELTKANQIIRHRGPDDEGFLTWTSGENPQIWAGIDTAVSTKSFWRYSSLPENLYFKVGLGHRRLSILDLSPNGHQPMIHQETGISIVFNGEIYNYESIKEELLVKGYSFHSNSDTEVLLLAWVEWGRACLNKLNGMFSFVILDPRNGGTIFAVRDRFGVKPLYWVKDKDKIVFCSEIKQIRCLDGYRISINKSKAFEFLATGKIDDDIQTFDTNIMQLAGGSMATIHLNGEGNDVKIDQWYELNPVAWKGTEEQAVEKFLQLLQDSVRLRLRADVPVGSALSGGLDSSAIVCIIWKFLEQIGDHKGQETVTACYSDKRFDEWHFASDVIERTMAKSHRVLPTFQRLKTDFEKLLWHQDDPFPSTSMFSQYCVFSKAAEAKLKVMIDGQGSDEQLAGYGGNELALYTGLLGRLALKELVNESTYYKKSKGKYPIGFLLGGLQVLSPAFSSVLPGKYKIVHTPPPKWINSSLKDIDRKYPKNLRESLKSQVLSSPLPSLLRYEDRSSMAWSIESRVPFLDYRFVEFALGLPESYVFHHGIRKAILRKALKGIMPDSIISRTDKMGFVTPEEVWLREEGTDWFRENINQTINNYPEYFNKNETLKMLEDMISGKQKFTFTPWRIICFGKWMDSMKQYN